MGRGRHILRIPVWAVAEAVGLNVQTVRKHARAKEYDATDLMSVVRYVNLRRADERKDK
jgi:hypothetical protein